MVIAFVELGYLCSFAWLLHLFSMVIRFNCTWLLISTRDAGIRCPGTIVNKNPDFRLGCLGVLGLGFRA